MPQALESQALTVAQALESAVDAQLEEMEKAPDEDELDRLRLKRIDDMKRAAKLNSERQAAGHGRVIDIADQGEFFREMKTSDRVVAHFYRPSTEFCRNMDKHIYALAPRHIETKFLRIDAERSPYLVEQLHIWCMPTLLLVKNQKANQRLEGFAELGGDPFCSTQLVEQVLMDKGLVSRLVLADESDGDDEGYNTDD